MDDTSVAVVEDDGAGRCALVLSVVTTGVAVSSAVAAADELAKLTFLLRVVVVACGDGVVRVTALITADAVGVEDEAKEATSAVMGEVWLLSGGWQDTTDADEEAEVAFFKMDLCGAAEGDLVTAIEPLDTLLMSTFSQPLSPEESKDGRFDKCLFMGWSLVFGRDNKRLVRDDLPFATLALGRTSVALLLSPLSSSSDVKAPISSVVISKCEYFNKSPPVKFFTTLNSPSTTCTSLPTLFLSLEGLCAMEAVTVGLLLLFTMVMRGVRF